MGNISTNGTITAKSFLGNATSASKWQTARSLRIAGNEDGIVSFDGSQNVTLILQHYNAQIMNDASHSRPYHRIAYIKDISGLYQDKDAIFELRSQFDGGSYGRFRVSFRSNESGVNTHASVQWIYRYSNMPEDSIMVCTHGVTGEPCYADVFYKNETRWIRGLVEEVSGNRAWILVGSKEYTTETSECWSSISEAATDLHSQQYSNIYYSQDVATVKTARCIQDAGDGRALYVNYSAAGLDSAAWLAAWNGSTLQSISSSKFAAASHTHNYLPLTGGHTSGSLWSSTSSASEIDMGASNIGGNIYFFANQNSAGIYSNKGGLVYQVDSSGNKTVYGKLNTTNKGNSLPSSGSDGDVFFKII